MINLFLKIDVYLFSLLVCLIMYVGTRKKAEKHLIQNRLFSALVLSTMVLLLLEAISWVVDGQPGTSIGILNFASNALLFALNPLPAVLWSMYASYQIFHDIIKIRYGVWTSAVLIGFNALMAFSSPFTGFMFIINDNNIYQRGPLFLLLVITCYTPIVYAFILIIVYQKRIHRDELVPLLLFMVPPSIGGIFQTLFYGISVLWSSMTLSLVIVYTNIQNQKLHMDYLTGVFNRRQLDNYLEGRICSARDNKAFSCILIDIDGFKTINDLYGHIEGDEALTTAAKLLKSSIRAQDFVARFAGDEFIAVLDINNIIALEQMVERIAAHVEQYNQTSNKPYKLGFSAGYAIYDCELKMAREQFLAHIDSLMYQNKNIKKGQLHIVQE